MTTLRARIGTLCLVSGCLSFTHQGSAHAQTLPTTNIVLEAVKGDPVDAEGLLDGCVQIRHLWKAQARALGAAPDERDRRLRESVFAPHQGFWAGYLGDEAAFMKWARAAKPLADDPRFVVPARLNLSRTIGDTARRMEQLTGRRACGEWFIVYGPGWTNMGGLGSSRMVLDLLGLPTADPIGDIRQALPHELNHLLFDKGRGDAERGTLLHRLIDEGFASYIADEYWGVGFSAAESVGYTDAEWTWAIEHEATLWDHARPQLRSTDRKVLDTFASAARRLVDGAPGKAGYFLGYRIVEDFVKRNGPQSWRKLYDLPLDTILSQTRFSPTR
jgi:hypothetical protein